MTDKRDPKQEIIMAELPALPALSALPALPALSVEKAIFTTRSMRHLKSDPAGNRACLP